MTTLIVIPTYNEKENISALLPKVLELQPDCHILVVDDSSPDGTGDLVQSLGTQDQRIHLLTRAQKQGLGRAYVAGFQWGLSRGYHAFLEMDADFSHRPQDVGNLLQALKSADFVVGSRYVNGGSTVNWGMGRKLISRGGSLYSKLVLGYPLNDWTGGFNLWSRKVLETIGVEKILSNGYSFQIEMKYRSLKAGFKGVECPITFEERKFGVSKMSSKIVFEAFFKIWKIRRLTA